jgi:hypothetical protein
MTKMRSPNYPAAGLSQAIGAAQKLWKEEKRTAVPQDVAGKALGYKGLNGPARLMLSAMKKYGLLEGRGHAVKLSDLAIAILHCEQESEERAQALRTAALRPELFRELHQSHREASDTALTSYLVVQKSFSDAGARQCIAAFRDTMAVADLKASGYSPTDGEDSERMNEDTASGVLRKPPASPAGTRVYSYPMDDVGLELRVSGDVKGADQELLGSWFDLVKKSVLKLAKSPRQNEAG